MRCCLCVYSDHLLGLQLKVKISERLTVLQTMRAGLRKWKGPRHGLVFMRFFLNCAYFTLLRTTAHNKSKMQFEHMRRGQGGLTGQAGTHWQTQ